ncbi:hypothetical protein GGR54DRAFT_652664 [Hypoxylon sp. NC1633]|nr:hypothetical protein GGR54DRAFT_652664 [Hypoxylon sp. NC1633]
MKPTILSILFAALPASAIWLSNDRFDDIKAGEPFTITWEGAAGPATISLMNGSTADLQTVQVLVWGATGTSYNWTPALSLAPDTYVLQITDGVQINYSLQFLVQHNSAQITASSTGTSTATATATSASHSASSTSLPDSSPTSAASHSGTTSSATRTSPAFISAWTMAPLAASLLLALGAAFA